MHSLRLLFSIGFTALVLCSSCNSTGGTKNNTSVDDSSVRMSFSDSLMFGLVNLEFNAADDKPEIIKISDDYKPTVRIDDKLKTLNIKEAIRTLGEKEAFEPKEYKPLSRQEQIKLSKKAAYEAGTGKSTTILSSTQYYDTTNLARAYYVEKPDEFIKLNKNYYLLHFCQGKAQGEKKKKAEIDESRKEYL